MGVVAAVAGCSEVAAAVEEAGIAKAGPVAEVHCKQVDGEVAVAVAAAAAARSWAEVKERGMPQEEEG